MESFKDIPIVRVTDHYEKRVLPGGFVQHREILPNGQRMRWQFYIIGFSDGSDLGTATVLAEPVPIRITIKKGRIRIAGKTWGYRDWTH